MNFHTYDDATSTFPTLANDEPLIIVDGQKCGIQEVIDKVENDEPLNAVEEILLKIIWSEDPDCIVYDSHAFEGGENYIFFEKGFNKLVLRNVKLRLGNRKAKNGAEIPCAITSDYTPVLEGYSYKFEPIAKIRYDENYSNLEEYIMRRNTMNELAKKRRETYKNQL